MAHPSSDRLISTDSAEALNFMIMDNIDMSVNPSMLNSQVVAIDSERDYADQSGSLSSVGYHKSGYVLNAISPQAPSVYSGGYDNAAAKQTASLPYGKAEGMDNGYHKSQGIHSESSSVAHGYSPLMLSRPYIPIAQRLSSARGHDHLYDGQQLSLSSPSGFQQPVSLNNSYMSQIPVSQAKLPSHVDLQGDVKIFSLRSNYSSPLGSSGREDDSIDTSTRLKFLHQGYDDGIWSDWVNPLKGNKFQLSSAATPLKPIGSIGLSGDDFGLASQQKGSFYGFGSGTGSSYRGYSCRSDQGSDYISVTTSSIGMNGEKLPALSESRQGRRCNDFSCSCTVMPDPISERNRGPRASKLKLQIMENVSAMDNSKHGKIDVIHRESYNLLDFATDYKDAKFFIIKSYSEDNVHKSIKYGVWASTANGNKRLDAAYRDTKANQGMCPIFLLFSVNASAQFCGVAEMVGPVDFNKSVDYWLQDKWSGQFPVKWHIIKDVPNSHFRHILLENNDNKPVTNSRDTQEVALGHGIEMLKIFKNYEMLSSIIDDFYYYEQRQKAMQEIKARAIANLVAPPVYLLSEKQKPNSLSNNDFVKKMSKSFAQAVSLTKHEKEQSSGGKVITSPPASLCQGR